MSDQLVPGDRINLSNDVIHATTDKDSLPGNHSDSMLLILLVLVVLIIYRYY